MSYTNCKDFKKTLIVDGHEVTADCPGTNCTTDQKGHLCHSKQDYNWYVCMNQTWQRHADVAPLTQFTCEDGIYGTCRGVDKYAGTCAVADPDNNRITNPAGTFAECKKACAKGAVRGKDCSRFAWSDFPMCPDQKTEKACGRYTLCHWWNDARWDDGLNCNMDDRYIKNKDWLGECDNGTLKPYSKTSIHTVHSWCKRFGEETTTEDPKEYVAPEPPAYCSWDGNTCQRAFIPPNEPFDESAESSFGYCYLYSGEGSSDQQNPEDVKEGQGFACYPHSTATPPPSSPCSCTSKVQSNPDIEVTVCTNDNDITCPHVDGYTAHPGKQGFPSWNQVYKGEPWLKMINKNIISYLPKEYDRAWYLGRYNAQECKDFCIHQTGTTHDLIDCPQFTVGTPLDARTRIDDWDQHQMINSDSTIMCAVALGKYDTFGNSITTQQETPSIYPNTHPYYQTCLYTKNTE